MTTKSVKSAVEKKALFDGLTRKQSDAVEALLSEPTQDKAAGRAGVNRSTLSKWLRNPEFLTVYRAERRKLFEFNVSRIQNLSTKALDTLEAIMDNPATADYVRASVAINVLKLGRENIEFDELSERMTELERLVAGPKDGDE